MGGYLLRTKFKNEIVSEFLPPFRRTNRTAILCGGMPSYPKYKKTAEFLSEKGYWVFIPRYRGAWESDGRLFAKSPHFDIEDTIDSLSLGFKDLWSGKIYKVKNPRVFLFGSSFGGAAALLASSRPEVKKAVVFSPVVDWQKESPKEPLDFLARFVKEAFGNGYRIAKNGWRKLANGDFYNPLNEISGIPGRKIYVFHSLDDDIVDAGSVKNFIRLSGARFTMFRKKGHMSLNVTSQAAFWKKIEPFLTGV